MERKAEAGSATHAEMSVGSRVAYSVRFGKSIGAPPTDELYQYRGRVREVREIAPGFRIAVVAWMHDPNDPVQINTTNLSVCL